MTAPIWFRSVDVEELNARFDVGLAAHLGMRFSDIGADYLKAEMPVVDSIHQPMGLVHGGANVALAETVGSVGANLVIDASKSSCVGQEINANHVRGVRSGLLTATARPAYLGRSSQVWDIRIHDERERLTCISRLTMAVVRRPG